MDPIRRVTMADELRRSERERDESSTGGRSDRPAGSPLGTDPQEAAPLPGDSREAQEPQEPRTSHIGTPGREEGGFHEETSRPVETRERGHAEDEEEDRGVVDQLRDAWDRLRGRK
jgi:hypothetical protein